MYTNIPTNTGLQVISAYILDDKGDNPKLRALIWASRFTQNLCFYKCFIDDVIGIWLSDPDPSRDEQLWNDFCKDMNACEGLNWTCEIPSRSVNFMDLKILIVGDRIETDLYEKDLNLYLYIPPHFTGLISGQICIRWLLSS